MVFQRHTSEFTHFEWDESKRAANIRKHQVDFADVARAMLDPHIVAHARMVEGEARRIALVPVGNAIVAAVYTLRNGGCRIVSARAARRNERKEYQAVFGG